MANKVFATKELTLQDETDVVLKPLPIGKLRRFMDAWAKSENMPEGEDGFDIFINCCGIALEDNFKGKFDALKASKDEQEKGEVLSPEYKEYLLDTLDLDTIYMILDIAGGINLKDPKLLEAAEEALKNQA